MALDLISTTRDLVEEARREVERTTGLKGPAVMISATHAHTGPVIRGRGTREAAVGGESDLARAYRAALPGKIAEAVRQAEAALSQAQANAENIDAQIVVQQAQIRSSQAQVDQAQAALVFAQQQATRYQELAATALAGTVQDAQRYTSGLRQQQAALASAQATLALSQRQIEALKAQHSSAIASCRKSGKMSACV